MTPTAAGLVVDTVTMLTTLNPLSGKRASDVDRPRLEGSIAVRGGRRLGFASFGTPTGRPIFWMHGTPGARRQIPLEARALAEEHDLRIIGIDRPGIGSSTPHVYDDVLDWTGTSGSWPTASASTRSTSSGCPVAGPTPWPPRSRCPTACRAWRSSAASPRRSVPTPSAGAVALAAPFAPVLSAGRRPSAWR